MAKTLILTGWKHFDYAVAAALALRHYGTADILGMSKRRLPEYLENVSGYSEIAILGVSLQGDPERLATALSQLKGKKVNVLWLSGFPFPASVGEEVRALLQSHISPTGVLSNAVIEHYRLDGSDLSCNLDENSSLGKKYAEFIQAAQFFYRNYQDEEAFPRVIRHIAAVDPEHKWSERDQRMINHYRRYGSRELVGNSEVIKSLQEEINRIAPYDHARVLLLGETGTGKETVVQQLHFKSSRGEDDEPLIAFNCASVMPSLLASHFLGYEKGAFTGAQKDEAGVFERANGGTLFLDEIGELPLEAQGILLRVLEGGRFHRLGPNGREVEVDVRVVSATNRDLPAMVRDGKFRADLYYRLCVVQLRIPPLREHKEDIPLIAFSFRERNGMGGRLTAEQIEALMDYDFPGNVRELNNLLERAYVLGITDYRELIRQHREMNAPLQSEAKEEAPDNLKEAIRRHVRRVCEKYDNNLVKASKALGCARNTVRKHLQ